MAVNVPGVLVVTFYYLVVLGTGIWASYKSKRETKKTSADPIEMILLGNRQISLVVGMFTTTGGLVFTKPMRDRRFVTMLDPFYIKYGKGRGDETIIFPIALNYLTPPYIAIIGIGAVAAAVMSSTDSALLSAATTFSINIYKNILRPQASQRELQWVIWAVVVLFGIMGTSLTTFKTGTLALLYIGVALTYIFMLPQLVCVLFFDVANGYGSIMGFLVSLVLRFLCGWPTLGIPTVLHLPGGSYEDGVFIQHFPVNTLCMLCSFACILLFSFLTALLFDKGIIPEAWDLLNFLKLPRKLPPMVASKEDNNQRLKEEDPSEPMMNTSC
ncbi:hypothetical protein NHX12_023899 [Muraenolepis orangiensis]|uniref:High-affinity choline transporter 1-like n=1 Tax=Muraenolepis orangiensis TaxID=630683 RepID=A0A9Q0ENZ6_9TELE|nr:hypothetical protein NHX12_023899 [Muraenolepis orangiensis]